VSLTLKVRHVELLAEDDAGLAAAPFRPSTARPAVIGKYSQKLPLEGSLVSEIATATKMTALPDGRRVVICADGKLHVWDVEKQKQVIEFPAGLPSDPKKIPKPPRGPFDDAIPEPPFPGVTDLYVSADNQTLVVLGEFLRDFNEREPVIATYRLPDFERTSRRSLMEGEKPTPAPPGQGGHHIDQDRRGFTVKERASGKVLWRLLPPDALGYHPMLLSRDGKCLAVAEQYLGELRFMDVRTGRMVRPGRFPERGGWGSDNPAVFTSDGRHFVAVLGDGRVCVWSLTESGCMGSTRWVPRP
jgi:hypothetical protein